MFETVLDLFKKIENHQNPSALNTFISPEVWITLSTQEFIQTVKQLTLALHKLGVKRGDRIGIIAHPSSFWTAADFAIILSGAVSVPLFANISQENFNFQVEQTALSHLFLSGQEAWKLVSSQQHLFEMLFLLGDDSSSIPPEIDRQVFTWQALLTMGKNDLERDPSYFDLLAKAAKPSDLATIIYTSGSLGIPKGAELSHKNIASLAYLNPFKWEVLTDRYLSILPLAHVYARALNFFMISSGIPVYYCAQLKNINTTLKEVHPTILVVVPRILEKAYDSMLLKIEGLTGLKKKIVKWAFNFASRKPKNHLFFFIKEKLADLILYKKLRNGLGGALKTVISGGAALNPELCQFFHRIKIPVYEGWGLTEAAPITVNRKEQLKIGTVGRPLDGFTIKIGDFEEILVKGPLVMRGYYKNPEETKKTFNDEGWLKTGDRGTLDSEGFLTILGRLKELYKTSTGEYVAPAPIEQALCKAPFIDMALIIAEGKPFTSCLLFPKSQGLQQLKKKYQLDQMSDEAFLESQSMQNEMRSFLKQVNQRLNHWEKIHAYRFILEPPTVESGELTPSLKIKRAAVLSKYQALIESMYIPTLGSKL